MIRWMIEHIRLIRINAELKRFLNLPAIDESAEAIKAQLAANKSKRLTDAARQKYCREYDLSPDGIKACLRKCLAELAQDYTCHPIVSRAEWMAEIAEILNAELVNLGLPYEAVETYRECIPCLELRLKKMSTRLSARVE